MCFAKLFLFRVLSWKYSGCLLSNAHVLGNRLQMFEHSVMSKHTRVAFKREGNALALCVTTLFPCFNLCLLSFVLISGNIREFLYLLTDHRNCPKFYTGTQPSIVRGIAGTKRALNHWLQSLVYDRSLASHLKQTRNLETLKCVLSVSGLRTLMTGVAQSPHACTVACICK